MKLSVNKYSICLLKTDCDAAASLGQTVRKNVKSEITFQRTFLKLPYYHLTVQKTFICDLTFCSEQSKLLMKWHWKWPQWFLTFSLFLLPKLKLSSFIQRKPSMTLTRGWANGKVYQNATSILKEKRNWSETFLAVQITTMTPIKNAHYCLQCEKRLQH